MDSNNSHQENDLLAAIGNHLKETYGLADDQVEQMVQLSATSLAEALTQAEELLAANDLPALSAAAHKAKGVLLGIGLNQAADLAFEVEKGAREGIEADYQQILQTDPNQPVALYLLGVVAHQVGKITIHLYPTQW